MRVSIHENPSVTEDHAEIHCRHATGDILWAAGLLEKSGERIMGQRDGAETPLSVPCIFYFEAVEKRTFACLEKEVFEVPLSLKEAEEQFQSLGFVRISKSVVVNLYRIQSVRNDFEMRLLIRLDNQETLVISRHYRDGFRQRLAAALQGRRSLS
ncbi:MAG TPA: LytTR family transcriptional regulator DNA-binding domain-containing protein [Candidatus Eisenbergiella merdavium]|uniref:LytTR family transcriptional regulator DNA-binding domain-containing protein n=1 Tax=Candidatus Eisenbergiella merdavium TaxID=2838551 RepID=A0A9D2SN94_9FIRM|nr:LytTR family transcriptional regulator DNA-binding domain-containing protein [Candidatus Eisenbergiella merdavium]